MAQGFGWSVYFMLGMMAVMVTAVVLLVVRGSRTRPVPPQIPVQR